MEGRIEIEYDDGRTHESVEVAAEFTDWNPVPLGLDSRTRYAAVFDGAEAASLYHYKFIVDGQWALLPGLETAHDRAGNVNHFTVAKPIPSQTSSTQSRGETNSNQGFAGATGSPNAYGGGQDRERAPGGGNFGSPAKTAERQAPSSQSYTTPVSSGSEFQDVTGFKSNDNGIESKSAQDAQQGLSSLQLSSEPFEVVKNTPSSYESDNRFTKSANAYPGPNYGSVGTGAGASATTTGASSGYDYAAEFDRGAAQKYEGDSSNYGLADKQTKQQPLGQARDTYQSDYGSKPSTGYEYTESQLPKESLTGGTYNAHGSTYNQPSSSYEYKDSQLSEPREALIGQSNSGFRGERSTKPNTGYEYTENQLLEPKEDVLEGAGESKQPSSSAYGSAYGSKRYDSAYDYKESQLDDAKENIRGSSSGIADTLSQRNTGYEYKESQLDDAKEDLRAGSSGFTDTTRKPNTGYEYTESELTKPKEKVAENITTDDEFADAYEDASMPGSLPFERKVLGGNDVPGNALDAKPTDYSSRPSTAGKSTYGNASTSSRGDTGEQSFYDSALEQLDEDDEADVFQESRTDPSELDEATGLPASLSDRTISKSGGGYAGGGYSDDKYSTSNYSRGGESQLDESAAQKILDETPSTPTKERKTYEPEPYATSYSPQNHQPIDVNTGFPIDHPENYGSLGSQKQSRNHGPSLRNHEHRRSLNRRDRDPAPPPITSQEHRNAAVIAAASKASAFAKQDVAAISGRIETNRGSQSSPQVSRGPSVRSSQGFGRSRDSGQFSYSPTSQQTASSSAPRPSSNFSPQQPQYASTSSPAQAAYTSNSSSPAQVQTQQAPQAQTQQQAQAQQPPRLAVNTTSAAGTGAGAAAVPTSIVGTGRGTNSDSISSASSDASQLQRSSTTKKEGRFKRLFKLH